MRPDWDTIESRPATMFGRDDPPRGYVRRFDFDPDVALWDAIPVIVAALDDEGLALTDERSAPIHSRCTATIVDGRKVVTVPSWRIVPKPTSAPQLEVLR